MSPDAIVTQVGGEAQRQVGFHCIQPFILKRIGTNLVMETNAAPFLPHIQENTPLLPSDTLHCQRNLLSTITAKTAKDIAGKALTMNPDQHRLPGRYVSHHQGDMLIRVDITPVGNSSKLTILRWQLCLGHLVYQLLVTAAVSNKVSHTHYLNPMPVGEFLKLRQPRHRAIFIHNLADNTRWIETSQPCQVNYSLGVPRPYQNTTFSRP